ncbi:hypothetical protein [Enterococcus faecalis]|uniref:hypothetical protein n=1 Tax=Enterococcus faecalis TaxID=1351 RepID=UPI0003532A57|nr:hypothetical protein [Enterococcus faecalis]EPI39727.1 hypothetical protein D347_00941 [Enterococcus faecalis LA3B-2]MDU2264668.1 hypothetical protein [Enterococcus faecalis]
MNIKINETFWSIFWFSITWFLIEFFFVKPFALKEYLLTVGFYAVIMVSIDYFNLFGRKKNNKE